MPPEPADDPLLGYLSALNLADSFAHALGDYMEAQRAGTPIDLDTPALTMTSASPVVLGVEGRTVSVDPLLGRQVMFTYRQVNDMAELLADALPGLAARAHEAHVAGGSTS